MYFNAICLPGTNLATTPFQDLLFALSLSLSFPPLGAAVDSPSSFFSLFSFLSFSLPFPFPVILLSISHYKEASTTLLLHPSPFK
jgi:hypothetical protein